MTFTSIDCSTVWMIDITCFSPGIESPSTSFWATSSTFMTAGSASEDVEVRDPSAAGTGGTGERRRKGVSRLISMSNEESHDSIQNTIYEILSQCGRERLQTDFASVAKSELSLM